MYMFHSIGVEVRGKLVAVFFLLVLCGSQGSNSHLMVGTKHLYLLSHFVSSRVKIFWVGAEVGKDSYNFSLHVVIDLGVVRHSPEASES